MKPIVLCNMNAYVFQNRDNHIQSSIRLVNDTYLEFEHTFLHFCVHKRGELSVNTYQLHSWAYKNLFEQEEMHSIKM